MLERLNLRTESILIRGIFPIYVACDFRGRFRPIRAAAATSLISLASSDSCSDGLFDCCHSNEIGDAVALIALGTIHPLHRRQDLNDRPAEYVMLSAQERAGVLSTSEICHALPSSYSLVILLVRAGPPLVFSPQTGPCLWFPLMKQLLRAAFDRCKTHLSDFP